MLKDGFRLSSSLDLKDYIPMFHGFAGTLISPKWNDHMHVSLYLRVGPLRLLDEIPFSIQQWIGVMVSAGKIFAVYETSRYTGTCQTIDKATVYCYPDDHGYRSCVPESKYSNPMSQICTTLSPSAKCKLRTVPSTLLDIFTKDQATMLLESVSKKLEKSGERICTDTCKHANDNECDDGGPNSLYSICEFGSDCSDCGVRSRYDELLESKYYPVCGWIPEKLAHINHTIAPEQISDFSKFPQFYYAQWFEGKAFVKNISFVGNFESHRECFQNCLLENFMNQNLCRIIQYDKNTHECNVVTGYENWCELKFNEFYCKDLEFFAVTKGLLSPTNPPITTSANEHHTKGNPWDGVAVLPASDLLTYSKGTSIFVLAEQIFTGDEPDSWNYDEDLRVALLPFYAFPAVLGVLFLFELCYKTPTENNPVIFTDCEFPFNWYLFMHMSCSSNIQRASNIKILLLAYTLTVWSSMILPRVVSPKIVRVDTSWAVSLIPVYLFSLFILVGIIGLLRLLNEPAHSVMFTLEDRCYQYRTLLLFLFLFIPSIISLCLWNIAADMDMEFSMQILATKATGLALHILFWLFYICLYVYVSLQRYMLYRLEKIELNARALLRNEIAVSIVRLKREFLMPKTESRRLVEILHYLVKNPSSPYVSREELLELGAEKMAVLEYNKTHTSIEDIWNREVAKEYGLALHKVSSLENVNRFGKLSPTSSRRVKLSDLGVGYFDFFFMLLFKQDKLYKAVEEILRDTTTQPVPPTGPCVSV